jgi:S1-C subfamily serine protease
VGTSVFTLGYPLAQALGKEVKFTDGKISSKTGYQGDFCCYQISVPVQPGNSGGPLFDEVGGLIGVINAKVTNAENVSYAIKSSYLLNLLDAASIEIKEVDSSKLATSTDKVKELSKFTVFIKVK